MAVAHPPSMTRDDRYAISLFVAATALSRVLCRSRFLYDLDSVNFALGMLRFNPRAHQPHPPGYFLYICLGRFINALVHDANLALVLLSVLASCGLVAVIYVTALEWFGRRTAWFASAICLLSPLGWFHGIVALTYAVEASFSALMGWLCWRILRGQASLLPLAAFVLAGAAGVRPSSFLFLAPLLVWSARHSPRSQIVKAAAVLVLTLAAWFFPMIHASGGLSVYYAALDSLWRLVPARDTVINSSPVTSVARLCTIVFIGLLCFGTSTLSVFGVRRYRAVLERSKVLFTAVWIAPALCFFTFIFLRFVNSGYLLLLLPAGCLWLGNWTAIWYERSSLKKPCKLAILTLCATLHTVIFLTAPLYCSYRSVRHFEASLVTVRAALLAFGTPEDTIIVGLDSHFLGYRHAGYYLPEYLTVQYPAMQLEEGPRIFAMHERETTLLTQRDLIGRSHFVIFPLPGEEAAYREYLEMVTAKLPKSELRLTRIDSYTFASGPTKDLVRLFP